MPNSLELIVVEEPSDNSPQEKDIRQAFSYEYGALRSKVLNSKPCRFEVSYCREEEVKSELLNFFRSDRAIKRYSPFLDESKSMTLHVEVRNMETKSVQHCRFALKYDIQKVDKYAELKQKFPGLEIFAKHEFKKTYQGEDSILVIANSKGKLEYQYFLKNERPEEIVLSSYPGYQPVRIYYKVNMDAVNKIYHYGPRTLKSLKGFDAQLAKRV